MRVLVTGDREWTDENLIHTVLAGLKDTCFNEHLEIIQGLARGADHIARHFYGGICPKCGRVGPIHDYVVHHDYPADWDTYKRAAGPIRNAQMLKEGRPQLVVAFHDDLANSKGTAHMVSIAKKANVPVWVVGHG